MSAPFARAADTEIDMRALLRALLRAAPVILILTLLIGAAAYAGFSAMAPKFLGEAKVLIEAGESRLTRQGDDGSQQLLDQEGIASQVQLVRSRDVARTVVTRLNLAAEPEFDPARLADSPLSRLLALIGLGRDRSSSSSEELVLDAYYARLNVYPVDQSRVIVIDFTASDPGLAARVANAVAEEYIALQRSAKAGSNADATSWLETQIADLRNKVRDAEARVEAFRAGNDLFVSGQNNETLSAQQLGDLNAQLSTIRAERADADARAAQIRAALANGTALASADVQRSELIGRLREQQIGLQAQRAELSASLLPAHPRMRELSAQLADLDRQIRAEAEKILRGLEDESRLASAREDEVNQRLAQLKAAAARANEASVGLRDLEREANAQRELLETYLLQYREAVARQNGDYLPADARIISAAAAAVEPYFPRKLPMAIAIMVAAMLICASFVLIRDLASGRATRLVAIGPPMPTEPGAVPVEARLRWPEEGDVRRLMPRGPGGPELASGTERSLAAIAGRIAAAKASRVLVVMAESEAPAGRPLAAVALARALARTGGRVLLIDFRGDGANRVAMGESDDLPGVGDLHAGDASFAQVIFRDRSSPAHFIPTGRKRLPEDLGEGGGRLDTILEALDHTYDHVVYDVDGAAIDRLAPGAGVVVLVTETGAADPRTVRAYEAVRAVSEAEVMLLIAEPAPEAVAGFSGAAA